MTLLTSSITKFKGHPLSFFSKSAALMFPREKFKKQKENVQTLKYKCCNIEVNKSRGHMLFRASISFFSKSAALLSPRESSKNRKERTNTKI
jgi:hypothetical protein